MRRSPPNTSTSDLVLWSSDLSLGLEEVDDQHHYLIERINLLWLALLEQREREVVQAIIEDLYSYTQTHFIAEEVLMRSFDYPHLEQHQAYHRKFVEHIRHAADEYMDGKPISMELLHFLNDWLQKHIKVTDRDYANYIDRKRHGRLLGGFKSLFKVFNSIAKDDQVELPADGGLHGLDMRHAIDVHVTWLKRLEHYLAGEGESLDPLEVARDDRCMLGNWIYTRAAEGMGQLDEFKHLRQHHVTFHECAAAIVREQQLGHGVTAHGLLKRRLRPLSNTIRFDIIQLYGAYQRNFQR